MNHVWRDGFQINIKYKTLEFPSTACWTCPVTKESWSDSSCGAVKQTQTGIFTALPCLQSLLPRSPTLTSPPRPLLRFGKIPSLTGSIQVCPLFYQWLAGASLTWSNPSRRQGLEAHNQWYGSSFTTRPSNQFIVQGFQWTVLPPFSLAHKLAGTSFLSLVNYKILVQYAKILLTRLYDCLRTRSTLAESTRQAAISG